MSRIDSALNPNLAPVGAVRSVERPLSQREELQRGKALCAANPTSSARSCSGNLFVGMFFDGTGNNEDADFKKHEHDPRHQQHSNVVRLYHAYPGPEERGTNKYQRYYIPGVGTSFPQIGDDDGGKKLFGRVPLGSAAAWGGEPRILWGLTRIFNAVYWYHFKDDLISKDQAKAMCKELDGVGSGGRRLDLKLLWQSQLKAAIKDRKPKIEQINLSVFGFSRGAAEARAFVNWLYEICDEVDGGYRFAGIPLRVQFLGIFDTVASVGVAGLYNMLEGRQSWADDNMQIHRGVERCLHMVAGHEVRACFPLDSVRIDGEYRPNVREVVYPGSHSDVGGGYMPLCLGQNDWNAGGSPQDLQLARVPGYDMYCAALEAGVPFYTLEQLVDRRQKDVADALTPAQATLDALSAYYEQANITPGPVEDMVRQHTALYLRYRSALGERDFIDGRQYQRAVTKPNANQGKDFAEEPTWLRHTQRALIHVTAALCAEIDRRMTKNDAAIEMKGQPLENSYAVMTSSTAAVFGVAGVAIDAKSRFDRRARLLTNDSLQASAQKSALFAAQQLNRWRQWLERNNYPEIHRHDAPEREAIWLLEALAGKAVPDGLAKFFDERVHDSMAGFIGFGMPEFEANGYGLAKFRRIYFGNRGDAILSERVTRENEQRRATARGRRNEELLLTTPPPVPPMGQWFPQTW